MSEEFTDFVVAKGYLRTEDAGDLSASNFEERRKRCYELTVLALLVGAAPDSARLIHGSIFHPESPLGRIGHAWLEYKSGLAWEPSTGYFRPIEVWNVYAQAEREHSYTKSQVMNAVAFYRHYGPWEPVKYK